jgi:hypothetical protein
MRYFLRELARQAGHGLDLARIDPRQWILASRESYKDMSYTRMEAVILGAIARPR